MMGPVHLRVMRFVVAVMVGMIVRVVTEPVAALNSYSSPTLTTATTTTATITSARVIRSREETSWFEVRIRDLAHPHPTLSNGSCCQGPMDGRRCPVGSICNTYFRLCLKEYQRYARVEYRNCTLGETVSDVVPDFGGKQNNRDMAVTLSIPIYHRWTETFTLVLDVVHRDITIAEKANDPIIDRVSYTGNISSSDDFQPVDSRHAKGLFDTAHVLYSIRVKCAPNHYTKDCSRTCQPRDDKYGHWTCTQRGTKSCVEGWSGVQCDQPLCTGCDSSRGLCVAPGKCQCRYGWTGADCTTCVPYPGCKHGSCIQGKPLSCECERNWGGHLCDRDLDVCGRTSPCKNGGTCRNTSPDKYLCTCPEGFVGQNCELDANSKHLHRPCERDDGSPTCANGGQCVEVDDNAIGFRCDCAQEWAGETCEQSVSILSGCASSPCRNGGSCSEDAAGTALCACSPGWTGSHCQFDIDECDVLSPCRHGGRCVNVVGGYRCACRPGWRGTNCTEPANSCHELRCLNGGSCLSVPGTDHWRCSCPDGFSGKQCELRDGPCRPNPCNGGRCEQLTSAALNAELVVGGGGGGGGSGGFGSGLGYRCTSCPAGRDGTNCEVLRSEPHAPKHAFDTCLVAVRRPQSKHVEFLSTKICGPHGHCVSSPVASEDPQTAVVLSQTGKFRCECDTGYTGEACHININDCAASPCANGGTCLDGVASFACACRRGFTGALCETRLDPCASSPCGAAGECVPIEEDDFICRCPTGVTGRHCNVTSSVTRNLSPCEAAVSPCENGGTCQDLNASSPSSSSSFICSCPPDFVGFRCQLPRTEPCDRSPCHNGATCVNIEGGQYQCWCPEGFEGTLCERNIDDCQGATCFHNATCVDGINRFSCSCPPGFRGADCRLDIDECASNPCNGGGTCIDKINDFVCVCPPGRTGRSCEVLVVEYAICQYNGRSHVVGEAWAEPNECSTCRCLDGGQVFCERRLCESDECDMASPHNSCQSADQRCVYTADETCFSPPCRPHAECRPRTDLHHVGPLTFSSRCGPRDSSGCPAKLTLDFGESTAVDGFTVEAICSHVRRALAQHNAPHLAVGCVTRSRSTLEVLLATSQPGMEIAAVAQARHLGRLISERHSNSSVLNAVAELRVDSMLSVGSPAVQQTASLYLICISVLLFLLLATVLVLAYKMCPRRPPAHPVKTFLDPSGGASFSPANLNNVRLPKMNNLSSSYCSGNGGGSSNSSSCCSANDDIGKKLNIDRTQSIEEMKEFSFGSSSNSSEHPCLLKGVNQFDDYKKGKPVDIPQIPDDYDHNLGLTYGGPAAGKKDPVARKGVDDVVWC